MRKLNYGNEIPHSIVSGNDQKPIIGQYERVVYDLCLVLYGTPSVLIHVCTYIRKLHNYTLSGSIECGELHTYACLHEVKINKVKIAACSLNV